MARRRKSNGEALIEVAALLPWWVAFLLALVAYIVCHNIATAPPPSVQTAPNGVIQLPIFQLFVRAGATVGQFIAPFVLVGGGIMSLVKRRSRQKRFEATAAWPKVETLNAMTWQQFEELVGEMFRRKGFSVTETGKAGPDGGVDLELRKGGELHLVQCKQWRAQRVGVDVVRELYGVMAARGAASGYVVTSGRFTQDAQDFAIGRNIELLDGSNMGSLLNHSVERFQGDDPIARNVADASICPLCSSPMVLRRAKKGLSAGKEFFGCSAYPACRGVRDIS